MDNDLREIQALANRLTMRPVRFPEFRAGVFYPPLTRLIDAAFREAHRNDRLLLPELRRDVKTLAIFSDYSGDSNSSDYYIYSFLVAAYDHLALFRETIQDLRADHMRKKPTKEISFKDLRYGPIARMVPDFLNAASNLVPGLLFTLIVPKQIQTLTGIGGSGGPSVIALSIEQSGLGRWKPRVAERLLRIAHTAAYLVALLSADHDSILPDPERASLAMELFSRHLGSYTANTYGTFGHAMPFPDREEMYLYDLLSLTDLAAGAMDHHFTRQNRPVSDKSSIKAEPILKWLSGDGIALRRFSMVITKHPEGLLGAARLKGPIPETGQIVHVVV